MLHFFMKKIGILAQRREYAGRLFNNIALDYISSIEHAGAQVIIIPIFTTYLDQYILDCDGFIFPGGPDIDPALYHESIHGARGIVPDYDRYLIDAMRRIFDTHKPILGICKGMQLLNVAHGGTLYQDIDEHTYHFQGERGYEKIDTIEIIEMDSFL